MQLQNKIRLALNVCDLCLLIQAAEVHGWGMGAEGEIVSQRSMGNCVC